MGAKTGIRWTSATWNPIAGCSKVSPGCANCYAETLSLRYGRSLLPWTPENAEANVVLHPERLAMPLRWPDPRRIFVNSMSDLFHELAPIDYIARVFAVMALSERHTYQVLTKRPERMAAIVADDAFRHLVEDHAFAMTDVPRKRNGEARLELLDAWDAAPGFWPLPNVWLGTSVENQRWANARIPQLLATPAAVRFLSCEPLLGPVDLDSNLGGTRWLGGQRGHDGTHRGNGSPDCPRELHHHHDDRCEPGVDWIIVGGESGPGFRPMDHAWARSIRDLCVAQGVAFYFKQSSGIRTETGVELDGRRWEQYPDDQDRSPDR